MIKIVIYQKCKKDITFNETSGQNLGFKIVLLGECEDTFIESSSFINKAYEIN